MTIKSCIATAALFGLCSIQAHADLKIGFTAPLSGPAGAIGQDQYDGFMLAVERLGGKLGGQSVSVIKEDDQVKPEVGLQAVRKLIEKDKVDALVGLGYTNVLMASLPQITQSGVIAIATNAGPQALSGAGCKSNVFSVTWQNEGPSEAMGAFAQDKNYKKVLLIAPNYQAGKEMLAGFKRFYKGKVADEIYTPLNQTDYSAEITQLQAADADALFVFLPGGLGINFVKQMRQAGMLGKLPVMSVFTVDATTLPALQAQAEGVIAGAMWDAALESKESNEFEQAFQAKYKRVASMYAAVGFDAANLLSVAINKLGGKVSDKAAFASAVKAAGSEFKSVRGSFQFNNNNMPVQDYHAFQVVRSGAGVAMKQVATPFKAHQDAYHAQCPMK
jgi:branched-chain amino acid transport system substrate-binding protein